MNQKLKKTIMKKYLINLIIGFVLYGLMLLYISRSDARAHVDALFVSGFILFAIGWFVFVTYEGIFDVMIYGFVSFSKAIVNKRPKKTLEEYLYDKDEVDRSFYLSFWLSGATLMALSISLMLLVV
jgi:hypothetical protein